MQSNKWGPHAWEFFHTISFNYPLEPKQCDKERYRNFFESIKSILPCSICKNSFTFFYENLPIDQYLEDRNGVVYWLFTIHNIINLKLENELTSFRDMILKYENTRARCGNIDTKNKDKLIECQKAIAWNNEMEDFLQQTINKYETFTIKKIAKLIKENKDRQEIININISIDKLKNKLRSKYKFASSII